MDDKTFLEKYNQMISDIENKPKTFDNIKQGDKIWYIYYRPHDEVRKYKNEAIISMSRYTVTKLEYDRNNICHIYGTPDGDAHTESNIGYVHRINSNTYVNHITLPEELCVYSFDKNDAINAAMKYIKGEYDDYLSVCKKIEEKHEADKKERTDEYDKILKYLGDEQN